MQTISSPPPLQAEVIVNENFETLSFAAIFGKRHPATTGLTWGYYGGRWGGSVVADGTLTLTGSATNYVVLERGTGDVSVATSTTDWDDTLAFARLYKLTTSSSAVTATEDHRAGPGGLLDNNSIGSPIEIQLACSDMTTELTTGAGKASLRAPRAMDVHSVRASLFTPSSSGTVTVDINVNGTSILDTKLTIDSGEETSVTAAVPFVFNTDGDFIADDDKITIDIDGAGTDAAGLVVTILGARA